MADPIINVVIRAKLELKEALEQFRQQIQKVDSSVEGVGADPKGLSSLRKSLQDVSEQSKKTVKDLDTIAEGVFSLSDKVPKLIDQFKGLGATLLGAGLVSYLKSTADAAARTEVLGTVLNVVAKNAGYTSDQIARVDKQVQSMGITASASRQSLVQFLQAGLDVNKAADLARAAQDLAVVSGQNSSETFQMMITNIQQLDTLGMRFMGIVVDSSNAFDSYAKSINKTAGELSQAEKQQAFFNAAMNESMKLSGSYEASMSNVAKQIQSLARLQENLSVSIGNNLLPSYSALVAEFSDFLKKVGLMAEGTSAQTDAAKQLGESVREIAKTVKEATLFLVEHRAVILTVLKYYLEFKAASMVFSALSSSVTGVATAIGKMSEAAKVFSGTGAASVDAVALRVASLKTSLTTLASFLSKGLYIVVAWEVGKGFGEWLNQFTVVKNAANLVVTTVMESFAQVKDSTSTLGSVLLSPFKALAQGSTAPLKEAFSKVEDLGKNTVDRVRAVMDSSYKLVTGYERDSSERSKAFARSFDETRSALKEGYIEQFTYQKQIKDLTDRANQAELSGDSEIAGKLREQKAELEQKAKKQQEYLDTKVKEKNFSQEVLKTVKEEAAAESELLKKKTDKSAVIRELTDAMKTLGVDTQVVTDGVSLTVSEGFAKIAGSFEKVKDGLSGALDINSAKVKMLGGIKEIQQAMVALASAAKSPEEIAVAMDKLDKAGNVATLMAKALKETLNMRFEKATVDELNSALGGLIESQKQLKGVLEFTRSLQNDSKDSVEALAKAIFEVTGSSAKASAGLMDLTNTVAAAAKESGKFKLTMDLEKLAQQADQAKQTYEMDLKNLSTVVDRKSQLILEGLQSEKVTNAKLQALEKETTDKRIEISKSYYDKLKTVRDQALGLWKEYASKVKSLDEELLNVRKSKEEALTEIRRRGMTEEQVQWDKRREADELESKAREALLAGDYEKAKEYGNKRIALEKDLAASVEQGMTPDTAKLEDAYSQVEGIIKKQRSETVAAADEQKKVYQDLTEQINKMAEALATSMQDKTAQIAVQLNLDAVKSQVDKLSSDMAQNPLMLGVKVSDESLQGIVNQITNAIAAIKANVSVGVSNTVAAASGGYITGPGTSTSDSIMARLSNGEFVVRAAAVQRYGVGFLEALNGMHVPRYAPGFASGGSVGNAQGSTSEEVALTLNIGKRTARVRGSRAQVSELVAAMQDLQKGVAS